MRKDAMNEHFTLAPDPDETITIDAAHQLRAIGLQSSGAFLSAAEHLIEHGEPITQAAVAQLLHEEAR
jgi:hypothetical protein